MPLHGLEVIFVADSGASRLFDQVVQESRRYDETDSVAGGGDIDADSFAPFVESGAAAHAGVETTREQDTTVIGLIQNAAVSAHRNAKPEIERITHGENRCAARWQRAHFDGFTDWLISAEQGQVVGDVQAQQF